MTPDFDADSGIPMPRPISLSDDELNETLEALLSHDDCSFLSIREMVSFVIRHDRIRAATKADKTIGKILTELKEAKEQLKREQDERRIWTQEPPV